nr:DUF637 domain-containing protein [Xenorhabdus bovienii]
MNVVAKGGYLYAQAQEEIRNYKTENTSRNWYGKKKTTTQIRHEVKNKVTEFKAKDDINLLSRDDSIYEASKIETGRNATLTSTHGKVYFKAVKDTEFDQTISKSKGFFIKHQDKGYSKETWILPQINVGGKLTIDAAEGITADIKVAKEKELQNIINILGNSSGTEWIKELSTRNDVRWNEVQDAYTSWNHENKSLNPVAGAVIAIVVAAVTAGSGLAVAAANGAGATAGGVATAAGVTATTATAISTITYGATQAGMAALASKAAVSLVNNEGNLSKTFKDLGNSETVKSIMTSMAVGGALAGFDQAMGWSKGWKPAEGATKITTSVKEARLPLLSKGNWMQTAQRVAGQSIISSGLNTSINGGSFKDNFKNALFSNIGNQVNAEGANILGNNSRLLGTSGKVLGHMATSALAAEIGGGDAKGGAAGALAAELASVIMDSTLFEPKFKNEAERQLYKIQEALNGNETKAQTAQIIGAVSGALISGTPEGVYSAANSADLVYRYNYTYHMWDQIFHENGMDMLAAANGDKTAAERVAGRRDGAAAALAVAAGAYATVYGGTILVGATAEAVVAAQATIAGCRAAPVLCLNNVSIFAAEVAAPEAALVPSSALLLVGTNKEGVTNLAKELGSASSAFLKNEKPNLSGVTELVKKDISSVDRILFNSKNNSIQLPNGRWVDVDGLPLPVPPSVGSAGRVPKVLQSGGNTIQQSTADGLNQYFGKDLHRREWGRALEDLKFYSKLPGNHHARILDNGDYINAKGEILGNISDYTNK